MKPDPNATYLCFSPSHDEAEAVETFADIYGWPPMFVFVDLGLLRVGPVPEEV